MKAFISKLLFISILLATFAFSTIGAEKEHVISRGIAFSDQNLEEVLSMAENEQKLVYASFYTTWCAPCQMMKLRTYRNRDAGEFFNEHFVSIQINGGKGDGADTAEEFGVTSFPTLVFIKPDGTIFYKTTGFHNADELVEMAAEVQSMYIASK